MKRNLKKFIKDFEEYAGQPSVYLLCTTQIDNKQTFIFRVALTLREAKEYIKLPCTNGLKKSYARVLINNKKDLHIVEDK